MPLPPRGIHQNDDSRQGAPHERPWQIAAGKEIASRCISRVRHLWRDWSLFRFFGRQRIGVGRRLRGFRFRVRHRAGRSENRARRFALRLREHHFTFTAIAAVQALVAQMVAARVLGAARADSRRLLTANTACKWHRWVTSSFLDWIAPAATGSPECRGTAGPRGPSPRTPARAR